MGAAPSKLPLAVRAEARDVAWWVLVGAAAGAIAGLAVGGVGGRLAMLHLRLTSPDFVTGMTSDDGFEIGVVTLDTVQLVLALTMVGAVNGVLYATFRGALPRRLRLPLWAAFATAWRSRRRSSWWSRSPAGSS